MRKLLVLILLCLVTSCTSLLKAGEYAKDKAACEVPAWPSAPDLASCGPDEKCQDHELAVWVAGALRFREAVKTCPFVREIPYLRVDSKPEAETPDAI